MKQFRVKFLQPPVKEPMTTVFEQKDFISAVYQFNADFPDCKIISFTDLELTAASIPKLKSTDN